MRNERTPQEILLAFFVAKFCTGTELPVVVRRAGFNTVTDLIDAFFARLGNLSPYIAVSRTSRQFRNSVLGLRNGDFKQPSKPLNQFLGKYQPIVSRCQTRTVEELWAELAEYREEARSAEHTGRDAPLGASGVAPSAPSGGTPEASEVQGGSGESYAYDDADLREAVLRQIRERRGQPAFRSELRRRYGDRCQVTGTELGCVIEAAHIDPYRGEQANHVENGLLLRADIHTLFDLDLLGIEPRTMRIELHPDVRQHYQDHVLSVLLCDEVTRPSADALTRRYVRFQRRCQTPLTGVD